MKIHDYTLNEFVFLNTEALKKEEKKNVLWMFDQFGQTELPSIMTHLKEKNNYRKEIDMIFLKLFGYEETGVKKLLDQIYELLLEEIIRLKIFMTEN